MEESSDNLFADRCSKIIESTAKGINIFNQCEWCTLIKSIKVIKFFVHEVSQDGIFNFCFSNERKVWKNLPIEKIKKIKILHSGEVWYRTASTNVPDAKIILQFKNIITAPAYTKKFELDAKKKEDIHFMINNNLIPGEFKRFYQKFLQTKNELI